LYGFVEKEPSKAASLFDGGGQLWIVVSGHVVLGYRAGSRLLWSALFPRVLSEKKRSASLAIGVRNTGILLTAFVRAAVLEQIRAEVFLGFVFRVQVIRVKLLQLFWMIPMFLAPFVHSAAASSGSSPNKSAIQRMT
jgi:hypothetical protein